MSAEDVPTGASRTHVLETALSDLDRFAGGDLTRRISVLEEAVVGGAAPDVMRLLETERIGGPEFGAALLVKGLARQIDVVLHTIGILTALPHILESGEHVQAVSLGAGNTGRPHDLETNLRIAEFTFIAWQGGQSRSAKTSSL